MTPLLRRTPLMTTTVEFHEPDRASVSVVPAPGRWPEDEGTDRLVVPLGIAALALARTQAAVMASIGDRLRDAAGAIADPALAAEPPASLFIAVSGLQRTESDGRGTLRVVAQLIRSTLGPVPTTGRVNPGSQVLADAAVVTLATTLAPTGLDVRLAAALSIEGLIGWYRVADPHLQPPQQAIAYALRHAVARLTEEGRPIPAELATAVRQHRKISPMAGGA